MYPYMLQPAKSDRLVCFSPALVAYWTPACLHSQDYSCCRQAGKEKSNSLWGYPINPAGSEEVKSTPAPSFPQMQETLNIGYSPRTTRCVKKKVYSKTLHQKIASKTFTNTYSKTPSSFLPRQHVDYALLGFGVNFSFVV